MQDQDRESEKLNDELQSEKEDVIEDRLSSSPVPSRHRTSTPQRPSFFVPPFPVPSQGGSASSSVPLTNHEMYELIQKSPTMGQQAKKPTGGSLRGPRQKPHKLLERQGSVIVGTPSFRQRYGKLFVLNQSVVKQ